MTLAALHRIAKAAADLVAAYVARHKAKRRLRAILRAMEGRDG